MHLIHRTLIVTLAAAMTLALPAGARGQEEERPRVASTIATITDIARHLGEDRFDYLTLAPADRDPHTLEARPSQMKRLSDADLFLRIGMQLEPWSDQVANGSGNPRIYPGGDGNVTLSGPIPKLEVPDVVSRSEGHIHPQGNPHLWLDPVRAKLLAGQIAEALKTVADNETDELIEQNLAAFREQVNERLYGDELVELVGENRLDRLSLDGRLWDFLEENDFAGTPLIEMVGPWLEKAKPLRGRNVVEYHQAWIYFIRTFGMNKVGTVEEKPGIAPGPRHIRDTQELIEERDVRLILIDNFYDTSSSERVARGTEARVVILPSQVGGEPGTGNYFDFIDYILDELVASLEDEAGS